jgi:hypothetical protein
VAALHVPVVQSAPAQQSSPEAPHVTQSPVPESQTNGSPQNVSPPVKPTQHGSPTPPHAAHVAPWQLTNGAVHATWSPQHASPRLPQVPFMQPPSLQTPCPAEQAPAGATQVCVLLSQQPPPEQTLPSQHGSRGPPHVAHLAVAESHARPDAVQKFAATPTPPGWPAQHACPAPPHGPPPRQLPVLQSPRPAPHDVVWLSLMQMPSTQHRVPAHVLFWQQGALSATPQVVGVPFRHTCVPGPLVL